VRLLPDGQRHVLVRAAAPRPRCVGPAVRRRRDRRRRRRRAGGTACPAPRSAWRRRGPAARGSPPSAPRRPPADRRGRRSPRPGDRRDPVRRLLCMLTIARIRSRGPPQKPTRQPVMRRSWTRRSPSASGRAAAARPAATRANSKGG
jgi:hypothetical protein